MPYYFWIGLLTLAASVLLALWARRLWLFARLWRGW